AARQRSGPAPSSQGDRLARIVAGAAHDIRSPLAALKGFSGTLLSKWDRLEDQQRRVMVEGVAHEASRMEIVVSQLVDAARLLSGTLELAPAEAARSACARPEGWPEPMAAASRWMSMRARGFGSPSRSPPPTRHPDPDPTWGGH